MRKNLKGQRKECRRRRRTVGI